jgi:hypothetical protein
MKKLLLSISLAAFTAAAQESTQSVVFRTASDPSSTREEARFQACESPGNPGFFWIDTVSGDLWRLTPPDLAWQFLGSPRGANPGRKGTYQMLPDQHGAVFILNTDNGEGWWTDGTTWKIIGELSRRVKKTE